MTAKPITIWDAVTPYGQDGVIGHHIGILKEVADASVIFDRECPDTWTQYREPRLPSLTTRELRNLARELIPQMEAENKEDATWPSVVLSALLPGIVALKTDDLRLALVKTMAVILAWIQDIDREKAREANRQAERAHHARR